MPCGKVLLLVALLVGTALGGPVNANNVHSDDHPVEGEEAQEIVKEPVVAAVEVEEEESSKRELLPSPEVGEVSPEVVEVAPEVAEVPSEAAEGVGVAPEVAEVPSEGVGVAPEVVEVPSEAAERVGVAPEVAEVPSEGVGVAPEVVEVPSEGAEVPPEAAEIPPEIPETSPEVTEGDEAPPKAAEVDEAPPEVTEVPPETPEVDRIPSETAGASEVNQTPVETPEVVEPVETDGVPEVVDRVSHETPEVDQVPAESLHPSEDNHHIPPPEGSNVFPEEVKPTEDNTVEENPSVRGRNGIDIPAGDAMTATATIHPEEGNGDPDDFVVEATLEVEPEGNDNPPAEDPLVQEEAVGSGRQYEGPDGELMVRQNSAFCVYGRDALACDFLWAQKSVYLSEKPQVGGTLKISIQNVHDLKIDRATCYDLFLQDVTRVQVVGDLGPSSPACRTILRLQNVGIDVLPGTMKVLKVSNSKITDVLLTNVDDFFALVNTEVQRLRIEEAIESEVQIMLHNVHLKRLDRLHLAGKASLSFDKGTIGEVSEGALVLSAPGNVMSEVKFQVDSNGPPSVLLKNGADVTLKDVWGRIRIVAEVCPSAPLSMPCPEVQPQALLPESPSVEEGRGVVSSRETSKCPTIPMANYYGSLALLILLGLSVLLNLTQIAFNQPKNILKRFVHVKRAPAHYDSLKTGQERRCSEGLEYRSFSGGHQDPWHNLPGTFNTAGETSNHGLQPGITINDVDEVLTGLRRRTPTGSGKSSSTFGISTGGIETLTFLDPNQSRSSDTFFDNHSTMKGLQQSHHHHPIPDWASEGQYLEVPKGSVYSYTGFNEERKII